MPQPTRPQLVLVELAAAAVLGGLTQSSAWRPVGIGGGVVLAALALLPLRRRWLFQLVASGAGLLSRRRGAGAVGIAGVVGEYAIEPIDAGGGGGTLGVVRSGDAAGTLWCVPLLLGLDAVLNDDAPVPVALLTRLLQIEDVPLASVRLVTLVTPPRATAAAPAAPVAGIPPLAARYVLLTVDSRRAAAAVADRGGSTAAVHQILRRCATHARQELAAAGIAAHRMSVPAVEGLFASWLGPSGARTARHAAESARESWTAVDVDGTVSTTFAVSGQGADLVDRLHQLVSGLASPVAVTSLVLQEGSPRQGLAATLLLRLSAPRGAADAAATQSLALLARAYGVRLQRLDGEQAGSLRATSPVGVGA